VLRILNLLKTITIVACAISVPVGFALAKKENSKDAVLDQLVLKPGDEKGNDAKGLQTELLVSQAENKAIEQVEKLIKKYKGSPLEADLQFRLAELLMRRSKTDRFLKLQAQAEGAGKIVVEVVKKSEPRRYIYEAISIYEKIAKNWPQFSRLDEVLYNHAFARQQLGQSDVAARLFRQMVERFPGSNLIPDAYLAVGEMNFDKQDFKVALENFNAIKQFPDSMVYPYGLYKGAWTQYNLRDAPAGLRELEAVIKFGRFVRDQGIDARLDLRKEALMDMALFFEEVYPAKKAFAYFESQADELNVAPVVLRLSGLYKRHSRYEDNRIVLQDFIKKRPTSDSVVKAYVELMDSSEKLKKLPDVVSELRDLSGTCDATSKWAVGVGTGWLQDKDSPLFDSAQEVEAKNPTPVAVCRDVFEKTALSYANRWLKSWQKDNTQKVAADATEQAFEIYLEKDPKTETSAKARFVYAELLFKRNKFRPASDNYEVASQIAKDPQISHDSKYFAILALEKAAGDKWSDGDEDRFKRLAGRYLGPMDKDGKFALDVKFKRSLIAYEKNKLDEAAQGFRLIGVEFSKEDKGLKAQDLYLDILNLQKKYADLKSYAGQLRKQPVDDGRMAKLNKIYEQASFLLIQKMEEDKQYAEAIVAFKNFAAENPKSPLAKEALWNAVQLQFKEGDLAGGAESSISFATAFPTDAKAKESLVKAAQTYESLGLLRPAADVLVKLAAHEKSESPKWNLMAADFYYLADELAKARDLYLTFQNDKEIIKRQRALVQLLQIAKDLNDKNEEEKWLKVVAEKAQEPEASDARLYFLEKTYAAGDLKQVFSDAKTLVGNKAATARARARARLLQARILTKEYSEQSLKTKIERIELVLQMKIEKLGKAQTAFQDVVDFGDLPTGLQALKELSDLYADYSRAVSTMELPAGVSEEETAAFRAEMKKLSIPMEEKSFETLALAAKEARKAGLSLPGVGSNNGLSVSDGPGTQSLVALQTLPMVLPNAKSSPLDAMSCPKNEKSWRRQNARQIYDLAHACALQKAWRQVGQLGEALAGLEADRPWGAYFMSLAAFEMQKFNRSLWMVELAFKKDPKSAVVQLQKGRTLWALEQFSLAIKSVEDAARLDQNRLDAPRVEAALFLAQINYQNQDFKKSLQHFKDVLKIDPSHAQAQTGVAENLLKMKEPNAAVGAFETAIAMAPSDLPLRLRVADVYESQNLLPQALEAWRKARDLSGRHHHGHHQRQPANDWRALVDEKIDVLAKTVNPTTAKPTRAQ
jgi:cellulose synthase operon protein C